MARFPTKRARSAGGVVIDDRPDGQRWVLLIARRNAAGRPQWTLPKGRIEDGETREEAALREVREETGYGAEILDEIGTIDYWFVWRPDQIRYHKFVHYYLMVTDGEPPGERDDEAECVEWVPADIALVRLAHRNERNLVKRARELDPVQGTASPPVPSSWPGTPG
jgi:8-oxo-dGTP pyrophosphatase MutT (NUDIX family)